MTTFAIVGGSGTVGRRLTTTLDGAGAPTRVLARSSPRYPVDLTSGAGLDAALDGVDVVIDASNGPQRRPEGVLVEGARRLVAAAEAAGVSHLVEISIVGIDRVPARYYRAKLAQEAIVRGGGVPWTIVRSTQFHELVAGGLAAVGRWRLSPRSSIALQPIAATEAADVIATIASERPRAGLVTVAGPAVASLSELARGWSGALDRRLAAVAIPVPGAMGRALRAGALTCPDPEHRGRTTFAQWLATTD